MIDEFPDPSLISSLDFYSSSFRIKRLMRRRGWQDVATKGGKDGFMPNSLFQKWSDFSSRNKLITKRNGGKEFERFVAQILCQWYCNPSTHSNEVVDLSSDFDVLTEGPGEHLFYFETKTSKEKGPKRTSVPGIWNFMVREATLNADMSVFLYDSNQKLNELLIPIFEVLYSLADFIGDKIRKGVDFDIDQWVSKASGSNFEEIGGQIGKNQVYFLYWPVVVIGGGDDLKKNIGEALALFYGGIKYVSPFERLSRRPTREVFVNLPHWRGLPNKIKKQITEKKVITWGKKSVAKKKSHKV